MAEKLQQIFMGILTITFMAWIIGQMIEVGLPYLVRIPIDAYLRGLGY